MKTEQELNHNIHKLTLTIDALYPQLSKYLGEIPGKCLDLAHPELNIQTLSDYYDSLDIFLRHYIRYDRNKSGSDAQPKSHLRD
jgi:hypothetical protein